jgi:hypothetical protein
MLKKKTLENISGENQGVVIASRGRESNTWTGLRLCSHSEVAETEDDSG